jgi:acyl-coenzyme A thioesterase 13
MASPSERDRLSALVLDNAHTLDQSLSAKQRIDGILESFRTNSAYKSRWDTDIMQSTTCIAASLEGGTIVYEIDIRDSFCTIFGTLHGGAASTILDQLTSLVLHMYEKPGFMENGAVTRTLTVTCLRPVMAGTKLRVETELVSIGKTMGNVKGVIKTMDGKICFACTHDRFILPLAPKL